MLARFLGALLVVLAFSVSAEAACSIPRPIDAPPTTAPNLDTMTADRVKITGGCIDGTPIGANTPSTGNFTNLNGVLYNAQMYGSCVWDGATTHDVGVCINLAIDAASTSGGTVTCPAGTFYTATLIRAQASYVNLLCGASSGTKLLWNGSAGGRMVSFDAPYGTTANKRLVKNTIDLWVDGNSGQAADGLYVASLFNYDLSFRATGQFTGGNVLNLDVVPASNGSTFGEAIDTQNGEISLDINVTGTSNQLRLGNYMTNAGSQGNTSFNHFRGGWTVQGTAGTGILCVGCDNNVFGLGRVFNSGTSVDLSIATSGAALFAANGNTFEQLQYNGAFYARGTATFPTCNAYTAPLPSSPCTYANAVIRDQTNGTPSPTIEAGANLQDGTNFGYRSGLSLSGLQGVRPGVIASESQTTIAACTADALSKDALATAYLCNTNGGGLVYYDDLGGHEYKWKYNGADLRLSRIAGTGSLDFNLPVKFEQAFTFVGSSSGSTVVQASAAASGTLTLPAATDTLVGKATTDVLTNKTLTNPKLGSVTVVASLPTCNGGAEGTWAAISDATAPTYNATLTGGGAVHIPVYCDGTNWRAH